MLRECMLLIIKRFLLSCPTIMTAPRRCGNEVFPCGGLRLNYGILLNNALKSLLSLFFFVILQLVIVKDNKQNVTLSRRR